MVLFDSKDYVIECVLQMCAEPEILSERLCDTNSSFLRYVYLHVGVTDREEKMIKKYLYIKIFKKMTTAW